MYNIYKAKAFLCIENLNVLSFIFVFHKLILIEVLINTICIYKLKELFLSPAKELMKATN